MFDNVMIRNQRVDSPSDSRLLIGPLVENIQFAGE